MIPFALTMTWATQGTEVNLSEIRAQHAGKIVEPKYQHEPRYSLLVIGPNAEIRIWLVMDGNDTVYVDLNGNSNLTDDGEKFGVDRTIDQPPGHRHSTDNFFDLGSINEMPITLDVMVPNPDFVPESEADQKIIDLYQQNGWLDAGLARLPGMEGRRSINAVLFTKSASNAQVTWLGGPLTLVPLPEADGKEWILKKWTEARNGKRKRIDSIAVRIGTFGLATENAPEPAFAPISASEVPEGISPSATFDFKSGAIKVLLETRTGGGGFQGVVSVPESETAENVHVELEFPNWELGHVASTTRTVAIMYD
jgi:hypothetical protein